MTRWYRLAPAPPRFAAALAATCVALAGLALASDTPDPGTVTVPGSFQEELGCPGDWQPDCDVTHLTYDEEDDVWQEVFTVPAGDWEYKAALNDAWTENYGAGAQRDGANVGLSLDAETDVKFYYDHETHWITDDVNSVIATAPGSFQDELGCAGDWQPWCLRSWLQDPDGDEVFTFRTSQLPAGDYEVKVAHGESWDVNYGAGGVQNGPNIPFTVPSDCAAMELSYELASHVLTIAEAAPLAQPASVTIPGSFQDELGCPGDWQPDCAVTRLSFDAEDTIWQGTFDLPAGSWEYKAALDDSWDVNYGANATQNGPNIGLNLDVATSVKFYYSEQTHWVTDNQNAVIATLAGSFQDELGCSGDWQPWCLRTWLQDPDGDGIHTFSTGALPAGSYEVKVAHDESWDVNFGEGGVQNGPNIPFTVPSTCAEVFFSYDPVTHLLTIGADDAPQGNLDLSKAHWVTEDTFAWNLATTVPDASYVLSYASAGGLSLTADGISGAEMTLELTVDPDGLPQSVLEKFPHLAGYTALVLDVADLPLVPQLLKGQVALSVATAEAVLDATSVQIPGVVDDLYTYSGELGVVMDAEAPTLRVWAPTAKSVDLVLYADADPATPGTTIAMTEDPDTGVWSVTGEPDWMGQFYQYEVTVLAPSTQEVETNLVTDPYSISLAADSARSQIISLDDPALMPAGWEMPDKPTLNQPEDVVVWELHVRDFSIADATVPEALRGTFAAFTVADSDGMRHLAALADAGLSHVHLLPSFDIATVPERREDQLTVDQDLLASYPPDSAEQQESIAAIKDEDGFNWGYDPWHYTVPEGSYATDPDGATRVLEFRSMVQALNRCGLRVVMDVVYNHTNAAGQNAKSVLDRIVPGYYHRLSPDGNIEMSSCCPNTATEHAMMEKLMIDSVLTWAQAYEVDGFRFDLMGHHMKANMVKLREALDALTVAADGVDGSSIYVYGEGWNFGEVADGARGVNATQRNMAGTGIGTFSDRLRDGVRGGNPFSPVQDQGFINGLYYDSTGQTGGDELATLLHIGDWIRIGLAGDLAEFTFVDSAGDLVRADEVDYFGQQAGYTADPQENVTYAAAHDNETLFDTTQLKAPQSTSMDDRVPIQNLANSIVALGQGIPFFHAGQDMLRSKSMDRDSFNSGDWFNQIDFTYQTTNWGHGLPTAEKNEDKWPIMEPLLADPVLAPGPEHVARAVEHFREVLRIRNSSALFRLPTAAEVHARVAFHNTGPGQVPGLIVMSLTDDEGAIDRATERIVVLFNATAEAVDFTVGDLAGLDFALHPVQTASTDPIVGTSVWDGPSGTFGVPARTTSVFVQARAVAEQLDLLAADVATLVADGVIGAGEGSSLTAKLDAAQKQLAKGNATAATNQLEAFVNEVEAMERSGRLGAAEAGLLLDAAATALASLGS